MHLKSYQQLTLDTLRRYLEALRQTREKLGRLLEMDLDIAYKWDRDAWKQMDRDPRAYQSRANGLGEPLPNVCLKIPTGGGKTLLAVHAIDMINRTYQRRQYGLVLWIVPTTAIYRQTLRSLRDRAHPYRQYLDMSSGGRALILEKDTRFSPADIADHLTVLLLMLPAANRQNKETLRIFRDQGGFEAFFPPEDQWQAHAELLARIPNLDTFEQTTFTGQRIVKTSLGNTLRLLKPLIVLDEGHKAYSAVAQQTLEGFNPCFLLELSATPPPTSNKLVEISGREVHREGMIKLDMHLNIKSSPDWRDTLLASHQRREGLEQIAQRYQQDGGGYIRPICLVQVERTGEKQRRAGFIHAEDARAFLIAQCNVPPHQIAVKSSERDEIEALDLLSPMCPIRYIITRQALQEGWDCPFAYVLAVLTNSEASASITQLVGRVLRQPYARKTGRPELDESYIYCFRDKSGRALQAVQAGLSQEGLGDMADRVVLTSDERQTRNNHLHPPHRSSLIIHPSPIKVYLPCFIVPDGRDGWREIRYEVDVLSRVDWRRVDLSRFDRLELNPAERGNAAIRVGVDNAIPGLRATAVADAPLDPVFLTRQLAGVVPNPWVAYDFAGDALARLRSRYDEPRIRRDQGFVIEELKKVLREERNRLAEAAFRDLIERNELRFYLIGGCVSGAIPERMSRHVMDNASPRRVNTSSSLAVALYLDQQQWVLAWYKNMVRAGYSIQGWQPQRVYPDFIALNGAGDPAQPPLKTIAVLETRGLRLKNADTGYKQALFHLCNERSRPTPWGAIASQFGDHNVHFQVIFEDEWQRMLNAMFEQS